MDGRNVNRIKLAKDIFMSGYVQVNKGVCITLRRFKGPSQWCTLYSGSLEFDFIGIWGNKWKEIFWGGEWDV
jgi:hypothetical protein